MAKTNYLWDADNILAEYGDDGGREALYYYEPRRFGNLIGDTLDTSPANSRQYHYDGTGSTIALTDQIQTLTEFARYTAFGVTNSALSTSFQFCGRLGYNFDSLLDLTVVRRRIYSTSRNRWLSQDLLVFLPRLNRYVYASNSPIERVDPSGLRCRVCRWQRHDSGSISGLDIDLAEPAVRNGIDAIAGELNRESWGIKGSIDLDSVNQLGGPIDIRSGVSFFDLDGNAFPKGSVLITLGIFVITADVHEDKPGDCVVSVDERVIVKRNYLDGKGWFVESREHVLEEDMAKLNERYHLQIQTINERYCPSCEHRMLFIDLPRIRSYLPPADAVRVDQQDVRQKIEVYDKESGQLVGWITQSFIIGPNATAPYQSQWEFRPGASAISPEDNAQLRPPWESAKK